MILFLVQFLIALPLSLLAAWLVTNDDRKTDPDGEEVDVWKEWIDEVEPVGKASV